MSVHYKFKSGKEAHTITFDSLHISVGELKKAIMQQRKIGKSADLDLQITNAQTKEVYESDIILIPKNTSVIVARVPVANNSKKSWNKSDIIKTNDNFTATEEKIVKNFTDGSEDDKIKEMLTQSTKDYDPSKYARGKGPLGPLPPNYTCYRCGKPGHYIKHCPTNNIDVKRSTGIPRSFMIPAKADQKGAMITASGEYAVPIIDHDAYREIKKEKPPFFSTENEPEIQKIEIPDDLKCSLCNNLLQDAVLIPCCGNSFCDECIRLLLLESDNHECPSCKEVNVSPDTLIPNRFLRISVAKFKNETGCGIKTTEETTKKDDSSAQDNSEGNSEKIDSKDISKSDQASEIVHSISSEGNLNETEKKNDEIEIKKENLDDELVNKEEELNKSEPEVKLEKENEIASNSSEIENHIEVNINGTNELATPLTMMPAVISNIHSLQPPYAMSFNNNGVGRYRNQIRVRSSGQPLFSRIPGQMMMPRNNFSQNRTLLPHDGSFYNDHLQPFSHMNMPLNYGYGSQIRGQMFDNMYSMNTRAGPMNSLLPFGGNMNIGINGHSMVDSDNAFYPPYKYDDYEDKLERFNRQLESRPRRNGRSRYNRSRSRSGRSKSRSKSYSSTSSRSSSPSRSRPSRRHSPSRQYGRRERSRSAQRDSRYSKSSSFSRTNRRPDTNYDKRNDRSTDRSEKNKDKDKERKYRSNSRRDREKDQNKETMDVVRKSAESQAQNTDKIEKDRTPDGENDRAKIEQNRPNHSSDANAGIDQNTNIDSNLDKVDEPKTVDFAEVKGNESPKPVEVGKGEEKTKPASKETKVALSKDSKDKLKDRHSKNKRNRSRSRSASQTSDVSLSDQDNHRSKKRSKKNFKDLDKPKSNDRYKSKSKHESKSADLSKSSRNEKSSSDSKHVKNGHDKSKKLLKEDEDKTRLKLNSSKGESSSVDATGQDQAAAADGPFADKKDQQDQSSTHSKTENLDECNLINKSEEMEIKIQEDYSDLENEEIARNAKSRRDSAKESNSNHNKENVSKSSHVSISKEGKTGEESHRKVKISTSKLTEKPLLSVTIENKSKIGSKISSKDNEETREKDREKDRETKDKRKDKDRKADKTKERAKERSKDGKSKDRHRDRDGEHSSHREHKSESSHSKSKSKDKKRDKEKRETRQKDDRSKRSHRRSRSRSGSVSARKKIKSQIDTSSSKHKSSKTHRK